MQGEETTPDQSGAEGIRFTAEFDPLTERCVSLTLMAETAAHEVFLTNAVADMAAEDTQEITMAVMAADARGRVHSTCLGRYDLNEVLLAGIKEIYRREQYRGDRS